MEKQNYDWTVFTLREVIDAPMGRVYRAWTEADEIERWFLRQADYTDTDDSAWPANKMLKAGLRYAWQWYAYNSVEQGVILEVNGHDKLRFTFAGDCEVTIKLEDFAGKTIISLKQEGIPDDEAHRVRVHLGCSQGWLYYLTNLKSVLQGGPDLRFKDQQVIAHLRANPVAELM